MPPKSDLLWHTALLLYYFSPEVSSPGKFLSHLQLNMDFCADEMTAVTFDQNAGRAEYITVNGIFCYAFVNEEKQELRLFENSESGKGYKIENGSFSAAANYDFINRLSITDLGFSNRNITHYSDNEIRQAIADY